MQDSFMQWCSWCYQKTNHSCLQESNNFKCDTCRLETNFCKVPGCTNAAKVTDSNREWFCAVHDGTIGSFETSDMTFSDLSELIPMLKRRDGVNVKKLVKSSIWMLGGALVLGPLAFFSAPALGTLIGVQMMGLTGAAATSAGLAAIGGGAIGTGLGMAGGTAIVSAIGAAAGGTLGSIIANSYYGEVKDFDIRKIRDGKDPALIVVDGFLTQKTSDPDRWLAGLDTKYKKHAVYHVTWESKRLYDLGSLVGTGMLEANLTAVAKRVAAKGGKTLGKKLGPLAIPFLVKDVLTNPWIVALHRAEQTGELIKEGIVRCKGRKFILVGHSLGARAIYYALSSLGTIKRRKIRSKVVRAHLLGGAVGATPETEWENAARAVKQKIISYRSDNDMILQLMYSFGTLFTSEPIGRNAIPTNFKTKRKIRNVDVTDHVPGHMQYHENLGKILLTKWWI